MGCLSVFMVPHISGTKATPHIISIGPCTEGIESWPLPLRYGLIRCEILAEPIKKFLSNRTERKIGYYKLSYGLQISSKSLIAESKINLEFAVGAPPRPHYGSSRCSPKPLVGSDQVRSYKWWIMEPLYSVTLTTQLITGQIKSLACGQTGPNILY